jgi:hypothetical protein
MQQRCIVLVEGFYEWKQVRDARGSIDNVAHAIHWHSNFNAELPHQDAASGTGSSRELLMIGTRFVY